MKKINFTKGLIAATVLSAAAMSQAQTTNNSGHASILIVPTLTVTLVTNASWGTVVIPSSGTTNYSMATSTGAVTVASGTGFSFGDGVAGIYTVNGGASEPISYSVAIGTFSGSGVTVVTPYINGTTSSGSGNLSALGAMTLNVGGILAVTSSATLGLQTATVTVTVNYA